MLGYLLFVVAALAEEPAAPGGTSWGQIGTIIGIVVASALGSGATAIGAGRMAKPPQDPAPEGFYARIDERTERAERDMNAVRKKLHRHGNVLLVLMAKAGTTPEEDKALATLKDDSEEDDTTGGG